MANITTTFAQNGSGDFVANGGLLSIVNGKEAYALIVANRIKTIKGEILLEEDAGIPYDKTVWESVNSVPIWKYNVEQELAKLGFVKSIESFEAEVKNGVLSYTLTLMTDEGIISVS